MFGNKGMNTTKIDRTIANIMIKKGQFEVEDNGKIVAYTTWIVVDDSSTEVAFIGESKSDKNTIEFRNHIATVIAKYRRKGKVVNPFA